MELLKAVLDVSQAVGIAFLIYNALRGRALKCKIDGVPVPVPTDEVKESFRRAALAAASLRAGGRRVEFARVEWDGNVLIVDTTPQQK